MATFAARIAARSTSRLSWPLTIVMAAQASTNDPGLSFLVVAVVVAVAVAPDQIHRVGPVVRVRRFRPAFDLVEDRERRSVAGPRRVIFRNSATACWARLRPERFAR